jgi:uncharacterized RDD family membrane protein YckC
MPEAPPDWYADPYNPGQPVMRYWDGARWTEHVHQGWPPARAATVSGTKATTTPDGQQLAGWGARFGAYVLDAIVTSLLSLVVGFPFLRRLISTYVDFINDTLDADRAGRTPPSSFDIYGQIWGPLVGITVIAVLVGAVYHVGFLRWRGATPGKMVLGLQVRLRDQPGPLPWGVVLRRWLAQFGPNLLGLIPLVGTFSGLYGLLDGLWPLWDDKRQALHDKWAGTNVVRRR